jgi:hypothetical protein
MQSLVLRQNKLMLWKIRRIFTQLDFHINFIAWFVQLDTSINNTHHKYITQRLLDQTFTFKSHKIINQTQDTVASILQSIHTSRLDQVIYQTGNTVLSEILSVPTALSVSTT